VSAPLAEVQEAMEDLALWGANTVILAFPVQSFKGTDDPAYLAFMDAQAALLRAASSVGLQVGSITSNQGFRTRPDNISACTDYRTKLDHFQGADFKFRVSVAKPGGMEYLLDAQQRWFDGWKSRGVSLDFLIVWPYDNGGSGCVNETLREWPWGSVGHPSFAAAVTELGRRVFPRLRTVVSMWGFDLDNAQRTKDFGEYAGLEAYVEAHPGAFDFTMTVSRRESGRKYGIVWLGRAAQ
jgi:hypothetical protein